MNPWPLLGRADVYQKLHWRGMSLSLRYWQLQAILRRDRVDERETLTAAVSRASHYS
jgi:hypothetical protein